MVTDGLNQGAIRKKVQYESRSYWVVFNHIELVNIKNTHNHPNYLFVTEIDESSFMAFWAFPFSINMANVKNDQQTQKGRQYID